MHDTYRPDAEQLTAEQALWSRWIEHRDPGARNSLLEMHMPYARVIAATMYRNRTHNDIEFEEYLQLASVGLLESFDRYDPSQGAQFRTFAARRMQGSILNGLPRMTEKNQQIAIQSEIRKERLRAVKASALEKVDPSLVLEEGGQLPAKLKNQEQSLFAFLAEVGVGVALGVMLEGTGMVDGESFGTEATSASPEVSYFQKTELQILRDTLRDSIFRLGEQEKTVIRYHYLQDFSFEEIGNMMGVKRSRVSQIHQAALKNLRQGLSRSMCDVFV